jgi:hypothetical protein
MRQQHKGILRGLLKGKMCLTLRNVQNKQNKDRNIAHLRIARIPQNAIKWQHLDNSNFWELGAPRGKWRKIFQFAISHLPIESSRGQGPGSRKRRKTNIQKSWHKH